MHPIVFSLFKFVEFQSYCRQQTVPKVKSDWSNTNCCLNMTKTKTRWNRLLIVASLASAGFCFYFFYNPNGNEHQQVVSVGTLQRKYVHDTGTTTVMTVVSECITGLNVYSAFSDQKKLTPFHTNHASNAKNNVSNAENHDERVASFRDIFANGKWSDSGVYPKSGSGSTVEFTTQIRKVLDVVITRIKIELGGVSRVRMLDVPCGDMTWMSHFLASRDDVDYTGFDIVPELIQSHRERFSNQSNWKFEVHDVVVDGLGSNSYDLVFNRMMLQHLYTEDVMVFLKTVSASGSKFLLTTTFPSESQNIDFGPHDTKGRFRLLNLQAPPVSLSSMICYSRDGPNLDNRHYIGLWRLPLFQVKNCTESKPLSWPLDSPRWNYYGCDHFMQVIQ